MKHLAKRASVLALTVGLLATGGPIVTSSSAHAQTVTFSNTDLGGYYTSAKAKYSFYFHITKKNKKVNAVLIMGDFGVQPNANSIRYAVPSGLKADKSRRHLKVAYKPITAKKVNGKTKTTVAKKAQTFTMTKKTVSTYTVKLTNSSTNRLPGNSGKTYTFKRVKTSPAASFTDKYLLPNYRKQAPATAHQVLVNNYQQQLKDAQAKGQDTSQLANPDTNPAAYASQEKQIIDYLVKSERANVINAYNFQS